MEPSSTDMTVLFADISGSTQLYETIGDRRAYELTTACLECLTHIVEDNQGRVIQTVGDEIMCTFADPCQAAKAAIHMQEKVYADRIAQKMPLSIRIGFHYGPIIELPDDIFGDTVNTAARICAQAKSNQILTSQTTLDVITECVTINTRWVDRVSLKGKREPVKLYELIWGNEEDWTLVQAENLNIETLNQFVPYIDLSFAEQNLQFMVNQTPIRLGRSDDNHLVIVNHKVSRQHARIEYQQGKFILTDQSTNGTFVIIGNNPSKCLHRDEIILEGKGIISLGSLSKSLAGQAIHYTVVNHPD